jgi:two-component system, NtrC family, response regulator AtoC
MQIGDKFQSINTIKKVLIIEDEVLFARAVAKRLQKEGYECENAETIEAGRSIYKQLQPDLVLLDMRLPDGNGLDLLSEFVTKGTPTIVMTAYGEISDAVSAMKLGAIDYLKKPIDLEELLLVVQKNQKTTALQTSFDYSKLRNEHNADGLQLVGDSPAMQSVRQQISRIAQLSAMTDVAPPTVLIVGETGTGKDVVARFLHGECANSDKPFVHVDCASLPADLIESELFGHEKGAYTNAVATRPGLIESAEEGTLFLDEIGELPLALQAKLLNVLERRVVRRLGSTKERAVPARIIAATNRDLHEMVHAGKFRSDLYYRLNVITMNMPPLRERGDDTVQLSEHFKAMTEKRYGLERRSFSGTAINAIKQYAWPGNVRELRHQISRAVLLSTQDQVTAIDLALPNKNVDMLGSVAEVDTQLTLDAAEKAMLMSALEQSRYNVSKAARILGITRMTMRYRIEKHAINI